jgi:hypothetical protein
MRTVRCHQCGCVTHWEPLEEKPRMGGSTAMATPMETEEGRESVTLSCYRITPQEGIPEKDLNTYSVIMILPDGDYRHEIFLAKEPEDVASALRIEAGTRVIMTQMANDLIWDSEPAGYEGVATAESTG